MKCSKCNGTGDVIEEKHICECPECEGSGAATCSALEAENIALRSMCWAAAKQIEEQWEHHCDEEGYGPRNLIARLNGTLAPDLYGGGVSKEDAAKYQSFKQNAIGEARRDKTPPQE